MMAAVGSGASKDHHAAPWDADDNCWGILTNPGSVYRWLFEGAI